MTDCYWMILTIVADTAGETYNGGADDDTIRLFGNVYFHSSGSVNLRDDTLTSALKSLEINDFSVSGVYLDVQIQCQPVFGAVGCTTVSASIR